MADKFAGGILAGATSVDIPILLRVKSDGSELTGKVATAVAAYYWRQSAVSAVEITCATLGSLGAAYSAGGWYEVGSVMPGAYRLCLPNTAVSTGAEWVVIGVKDTAGSGFAFYERYALETVHNAGQPAYADIQSAASAAWQAAAGTVRVYPADGALTAAVFGADCITSAKVAAGAFVYDDQITTFKSELSGLVIAIPNGHITSAKIGADAIGSDKVAPGAFVYSDQITGIEATVQSAASAALSARGVSVFDASATNVTLADGHLVAAKFGADCITSAKIAAGALTYDDQITTFKSELSGMAISIPNGHITSAKIGADAIGSDKIAAGAMVYGDQLTAFDADIKSAASAALAAWGKTDFRLSTQGVRDITQYTSAQGGFPGSSAALIDALYWGVAQSGYKRIQTPTTYLVHDAAGNALASAPISGTSTSVTIGIFTNV